MYERKVIETESGDVLEVEIKIAGLLILISQVDVRNPGIAVEWSIKGLNGFCVKGVDHENGIIKVEENVRRQAFEIFNGMAQNILYKW